MSDHKPETTDFRPTESMAKSLTKAELRGCRRLADRIAFDLYVTPDLPTTWPWRERQEVALAVIEERIKNGR